MKDLEGLSSSPFRFSDPRQQRIYEHLLLIGAGPASFFKDACILMTGELPLDSTINLIAHLFREIESAIRAVLLPISYKMSQRDKFFEKNTHSREILSIIKALDIPEDDPVARSWFSLADTSNEYTLPKLAHRNALSHPRSHLSKFQILWDELQAILDVILEKFRHRFLDILPNLDDLLAKSDPSLNDAKILRNKVPNNLVTLGYFFDRCYSVSWLIILKDEGFFKYPPEPEYDEDKRMARYPYWPESRYLARMAHHDPELVSKIILEIPETENFRVHEDLVDAVLAMPTEYASQLLENAKKWAHSSSYFLLSEKLGDLVTYLARGGQVDAALGLAGVLLEVWPDPKINEKSLKEDCYSLPPTPVPRFGLWEYGQILKKNVPELVKAGGVRAYDLLCNLLETAVHLSIRPKEQEGPDDSSYVWRPAIEDHEQNGPEDLKDMLVSAVRNAAESLAKDGIVTISDLVKQLESRSWHIFHRMALYLLSRFPSIPVEIVAGRLTDHRLFDDICFRHEYSLLLKEKFSTLNDAQKQIILGWIKEGPDLGKEPSEDDLVRYRSCWQRDRLAWFHDSLPEEWKGRYNALVGKFGESKHPEFSFYKTTWVGTTSPKSAEEMKTMTVSEIIAFLQTWIPSEGFTGPSTEGLGIELTQVVIGDPNRFAQDADKFQVLSPTYIYALLSGFRDTICQEKTFEWPPVVTLCQWVINQDQGIEDQIGDEKSEDRKRNSMRQTIAELLKEGFKEVPACLPMGLRRYVWNVIEPLTWDPHPTPEYEARYGGSNMDPSTMSINTTRGQAMHSVLQYALWIRRHLEKLPERREHLVRGLDEMPEVRVALEEHLDLSREPSLAIRAVYGQWFPSLVFLDSAWAARNAERIFPESETGRLFWHAAWNTYITICQPYDNVFDVSKEQYEIAVDRIGVSQQELRTLRNTEERLAEHLMIFYWQGKLNLKEVNGLQNRFWQKATEVLRGHAIEFIGRSLWNTEGTVPFKILGRIMALWDNRLAVAKAASSPKDYSTEMAAFGWWFGSKKLEEPWAVTQLLEALKISGKIEADHLVLEQLAALVYRKPIETVQCLELLVRGDREGWQIYHWRNDARAILSYALQSGEEAVEIAEDLIHYMGSRGYLEFRDLIV